MGDTFPNYPSASHVKVSNMTYVFTVKPHFWNDFVLLIYTEIFVFFYQEIYILKYIRQSTSTLREKST